MNSQHDTTTEKTRRPCVALNDQQVREVRTLHAAGYAGHGIARAYGVCPATAFNIVRRHTRAGVTDAPTPLPDLSEPRFVGLERRLPVGRPANRVLTDEQVQQIRRLRRQGYLRRSVGAHFGVSEQVVGKVCEGITYRSVPHNPSVPLPNVASSKLTRLSARGSLTKQQVREVRGLVRAGYTQRSVATLFGISQPMVCEVVTRHAYANVPNGPTPLGHIVNDPKSGLVKSSQRKYRRHRRAA